MTRKEEKDYSNGKINLVKVEKKKRLQTENFIFYYLFFMKSKISTDHETIMGSRNFSCFDQSTHLSWKKSSQKLEKKKNQTIKHLYIIKINKRG